MLSAKLLQNTWWAEREVPMDIFHLLRTYIGNSFCPKCASYLSCQNKCVRCNSSHTKFVVVFIGCNRSQPIVYNVITIEDDIIEQFRKVFDYGQTCRHFGVEDLADVADRDALHTFYERRISAIECTGELKPIMDRFSCHYPDYILFTPTFQEHNLISFRFDIREAREHAVEIFRTCPCHVDLAFIELREGFNINDIISNICVF